MTEDVAVDAVNDLVEIEGVGDSEREEEVIVLLSGIVDEGVKKIVRQVESDVASHP